MSRALLVLVLCAAAGPAPAQSQGPPPGFLGRDREMMHPEVPLELVGMEQDETSFRTRTPALERSDRTAALVDVDELRERKLSLYADGERFVAAPTALGAWAGVEPEPRDRKAAPAQAVTGEEDGEDDLTWLGMVAGAVLAAAAAYVTMRE